jgi:hypothetical protein
LGQYVQAVKDQAAIDGQELSTLVRQPEFYERVIKRVEAAHKKDALARDWLKEVLPALS